VTINVSGTQTLSGADSYTGTTTIGGTATAWLNGSHGLTGAGAGSYTVNSAATLGGTGAINFASSSNGLQISAGATFIPGYAPTNGPTLQALSVNNAGGSSAFNAVNLNASSTFQVTLNPSTNQSNVGGPNSTDYLSVALGAVNLNGAKLSVAGTGALAAGQAYTLIDDSTLNGTQFASSTGFVNGIPYVVTYNNGTSGADVVLTLQAVPEPHTMALGLIAAAGGLWVAARRRTKKA
jgi:hypothetical protein